jgi:hypothetical protein
MDPNNPIPTPENVTPPPSGGDQTGKRSADERIDQLIAQIKGEQEEKEVMRQELEDLKKRVPPPPPPVGVTPDAQRAIDALKGLGFVREEDVEKRIKNIEGRYQLNSEHSKYETEFNGNDGRPKYNRSEIEKFMKEREIYDPLAAYKLMNETELLDWRLKQSETKDSVHMETPTGGLRQDEADVIKEKLHQHVTHPTEDSKQWYEENRLKILDMNSRGELT